jgi:hypothetical protein
VVKKINMHLNDCDKGICPTFFFMLIDNGSLVVSFDLLLWENQVLRKQAFDKNAMEIPKRPKSSLKKKKKKVLPSLILVFESALSKWRVLPKPLAQVYSLFELLIKLLSRFPTYQESLRHEIIIAKYWPHLSDWR